MCFRITPLLLALFLPVCISGQSAASENSHIQDASNFAGVWRGQFDGLPGIDIVISDEGRQLAGGILFYFHFRPDAGAPSTSTPGLPEPMLNLSIEGDTLRFQVSHRRAHPPGSLKDPPVSFRFTMSGPDKATLVNENEGKGPELVMTRSDY